MLLSQRREMPQLHTKIPEGLDTPRGFVAFNGAPDKICTRNLRIRSPMLYPVELPAQFVIDGGEAGI